MLRIHWERWKHWKEHPEYKVSSDGRIKLKGKLVTPKMSSGGYLCIRLEKELLSKNESTAIHVHTLVAHVFLNFTIGSGLSIDHLNHNKRDNSIQNLEVVTKAENLRRAKQDLINISETPISEDKLKNIKTVVEDIIANTNLTKTWINSAIKPILRNYTDKYYILKDGKYLALDDVSSLIDSKLFRKTELASKSAFKQDINTLVGMLKVNGFKNDDSFIYRKHLICRKQQLQVIPQA